MSKFTQGDWYSEFARVDGKIAIYANDPGLDFTVRVATVTTWFDDEEALAESYANGRLMAAAPALYSALLLMVEVFDRDAAPLECLNAARAALEMVEVPCGN